MLKLNKKFNVMTNTIFELIDTHNEKEIDSLLKNNQSLIHTYKNALNPLMYALTHKKFGLFDILVKYNPNFDNVDEDKNNALHLCVKDNHLILTKKILKLNKLDIDSKNKEGYSALFYAIMNNNEKTSTLLLDNYANLDLINWFDYLHDYKALKDKLIAYQQRVHIEENQIFKIKSKY